MAFKQSIPEGDLPITYVKKSLLTKISGLNQPHNG